MSEKVVIIGAGIAGMSAAYTLSKSGIKSLLISPMPSQRSQSVMAQGGINGALNTMGEDDSPALHAQDTLKAGRFLADEMAVKNLCDRAPDLLLELQSLGMSFTLTSFDEKKIRLRAFGGQSKKRTAYADTLTGRQLVNTLISALRKYEIEGLCERLLGFYFVRISKDQEGKANGVYVYSRINKELRFVPAKAVIFCSGGLNGLFGDFTGSIMNEGIATASLLESGVEMANLEMIQYHPTTVRLYSKNLLISEAARGEGGRLFVIKDGKPWYFMEEKYPEQGNLMPRDVVSKEENELIKQGYQVFLDLRGLDKSVYKKKLKSIVLDCKEFMHLDVTNEPIPVAPSVHYFMGGIKVDLKHRTNICGVYAAGECACQYHGANRLGGNSTLGAYYGGKVAAKTIIEDFSQLSKELREEPCPTIKPQARVVNYAKNKRELSVIMRKALAIERNEESLNQAIKKVKELCYDVVDESAFFDEVVNYKAQCLLSLAMLESALARKESRGAHFRSDYPKEDELFRKTTVTYLKDGQIGCEFRSISND